jgi:hypothetical protein
MSCGPAFRPRARVAPTRRPEPKVRLSLTRWSRRLVEVVGSAALAVRETTHDVEQHVAARRSAHAVERSPPALHQLCLSFGKPAASVSYFWLMTAVTARDRRSGIGRHASPRQRQAWVLRRERAVPWRVVLVLLCHKSAVTGVDEPLLAYRRWQHGQRGRRRARATVRRRRTEAIENGSCRSGRSGMPARPPTGG